MVEQYNSTVENI